MLTFFFHLLKVYGELTFQSAWMEYSCAVGAWLSNGMHWGKASTLVA